MVFSNEKISQIFGSPENFREEFLKTEIRYIDTPHSFHDQDENLKTKHSNSHYSCESFLREHPVNTLEGVIDEFLRSFMKCHLDAPDFSETKLNFEFTQREGLCLRDDFIEPRLNLTVFHSSRKAKGFFLQIPMVLDKHTLLNREKQNHNKKISFVSHEMRTPLNCIVSMLQILKPLIADDLAQEYVNPAIISCNFLLYLVQDILDLAQMESDKFTMNFEEFDIRLLVSEIIELFRIQASSKNTSITSECNKSVPETIVSDHRRIRQILINLIGNALKFIKKVDGQIKVVITHSNTSFSHIIISVIDNGIGIKDEDKNKLFQAFGKINNEENRKMNSSGVGLGLMISNSLAINLHPTKSEGLQVESKYGVGSSFSFMLEDKSENSNVRDSTDSKSLKENLMSLQEKKDNLRFFKNDQNSKGEKDYQILPDQEETITKKETFSSMKVRINRKSLTNHFYQLTPLLRPEKMNGSSVYSLKEHNERVKNLRKSLKITKVRTEKKQNSLYQEPSIQSFCDIFMGKTSLNEYEISETKMLLIKDLNGFKPCSCPDVLIVDDNAFNIYSLRKQLETFNFKIEGANDGEEAIKMAQDFRKTHKNCCDFYKIIFMDIEMPGKGGYQASLEIKQFLKENLRDKEVKIVGCSAHLTEEVPDLHKSFGMDSYVTKPIIKGRLVLLLDKLLNIRFDFNEEG